MRIFKSWRKSFFCPSFISLLLVLFLFSPIIRSFYVSDDAYRAHYSGLDFVEFLKHASAQISYWWQSSGRIFLITPFVDMLPLFVFNDLVDYKFYCYLVNIVVVLVFSRLLFVLYDRKVALVFPVFVGLVFQLRDYHDAILAFGTLYQFTFLFIIFSAFFAIEYSKRGVMYLWGSVFFLFLALVTMEVAYSLIPFLLYVVGKNGSRRHFLNAFFSYSVLAIFVIVVARYGIVVGEANGISRPVAYMPNFNPLVIALTFAKQVLSGMPLSYLSLRPQIGSWGVLANPFVAELSFIPWVIILSLCGLILLQLLCIESRWRDEKIINPKDSLFVFVLIGILPASVISFSPKYQSELVWGNGYLPVYIQYFGVAAAIAIIFVSKISWIINRGRFFYFFLVFLIVICVGVNTSINWKVVIAQETAWHNPMFADELILKSPEVKSVCQDHPLFVSRSAPWVTDDFSFIRRIGVSSVMRNNINIEGFGCIFASSFQSTNHVAVLWGPVRFANGGMLIVDETRQFTGTSTQPLIGDCDVVCSKLFKSIVKD